MKRKITIRQIWCFIGRLYVNIFERVLTNSKWFNPFATLYLNLRCVPLVTTQHPYRKLLVNKA